MMTLAAALESSLRKTALHLADITILRGYLRFGGKADKVDDQSKGTHQ